MEPGIYSKMSFDEYLADPCPEPSLTRSTIKDLLSGCPAKAWFNHPRLNPNYNPDEDKKFDIGTAAHALFVGGENAIAVFDYADWKKNEAKEARDAARVEGKTPLLRHQFADVCKMVRVANDSLKGLVINGLKQNIRVSDGLSEHTFIWKEGDTWCRIRPDLLLDSRDMCLDYKTTAASAYPEDYVGIITNTGLDIQEAFYCRGINAVSQWSPRHFIFMVQEIEPPYLCSFIELDMMFQDMGREKVEKGMKLWRQCMSTGQWPGYSNELYTVEPKPWALASWELKKHQEAA